MRSERQPRAARPSSQARALPGATRQGAGRRGRRDAGMVTAEMAVCLPVLVLVLAAALAAVGLAGARVRVQDAAREAARAGARGDQGNAEVLAHRAMSAVTLETAVADGTISVTATAHVHVIASWLPRVTITEKATALLEGGSANGNPNGEADGNATGAVSPAAGNPPAQGTPATARAGP